ncbi:hypothetical protein OESDEN_00865 [Oesophagostomum dentatum]|uniref:Uncharacterized protein n=1 Tax=Oesophagostomum dentatum TaxID=61180 RepID=A0A0B1TTM7_OESDE|nr:hypothetical protein OESDEN_00865 [Oesophagostomum dentatum]
MIISYLARIVLLLPDLSASDNDRLLDIAQSSHPRSQYGEEGRVNYRTNYTPRLHSSTHHAPEPAPPRSNSDYESQFRKPRPDDSCIPINDTLRKHLLQVSVIVPEPHPTTEFYWISRRYSRIAMGNGSHT